MFPNLPSLLNVVLLSLVAGLGTGVGGLVAILLKPGKHSFGFLMGIASGVMITLSFLELVNEAWELAGVWTAATIGFGAGAVFMFLLDHFAPHIRFGEQEIRRPKTAEGEPLPPVHRGRGHGYGRWMRENQITDRRLFKTGVLLAVGITIHNIPEGIAVGAGFMHTPEFGLFIALAILLHNSGMAEPIGALAAALLLKTFSGLIPASLAFAGGVMMFITLDELIPAAREHGHQHYTAIGIILGAIFVFLLSGIFGV